MLTEGMYVADRYEIIGKIGAGGMSDVYKAKDLTLGRFVAIKVLKSEFSEDVNFVTKFRTEAQSAAGLEHPNIVNIYDVGSENGMHYIVMEYVEGITLKTYIEKKGQLSFKEAVSISIQVGRGIEAAHNKNIIHRDIKPQNIIISTEGKVKVTDFGIARAATSNTISSDVMGSVHYSSPEQARNGYVDGKSDIYSLGIVMYEMVTGKVPFDGDTTVAVAIQHLQEEMVAPSAYASNLPVSMEKIIIKCTQKNADRRYESVTALLADLRKSLISPDEDFVVMVPIGGQDKTRVIGQEDINQIKKETGGVYVNPGSVKREKPPVRKEILEEEIDEEEEDDEDYDDGDINPKMEKAITIMGIATAVVIVAIIVYLLVSLFGGFRLGGNRTPANSETQTTKTETETQKDSKSEIENPVTVPNLSGKTFDEAKKELNALTLGIDSNTEKVSSDVYEEGQIVSQEPAANEKVEEHTTIKVTLSSGKGSISIPDVEGKTESRAMDILEGEGFKCNKTYSYSSNVDEGYVISQSPEADAKGKEGDTVTIEISQGVESVTVPDVKTTYKSEEQARALLTDFEISTTTKYSEIAAGIVLDQSIEPGKQVEKGSAITLTISLGPEPEQVVTPDTYKFNAKIRLPENGSNVAAANITLYDHSGNTLEQWLNQPASSFGTEGLSLSKTGILAEKGKLSITWLDANGNQLGVQDEEIDFHKE